MILDLRTKSQNGEIPLETIADIHLILREMSTLANDLRKETDGARDFLGRIACLLYLRESLNEGSGDPIRGELAIATPDIKQVATLPKRGTDEHAQLCHFLGINHEAVKSGVVHIHWPAVVELLTETARLGKPLPPGIDPKKTYSWYRLSPVRLKPNKTFALPVEDE